MKVYILEWVYDTYAFHGVFSSNEKAQAALAKIMGLYTEHPSLLELADAALTIREADLDELVG